MPAVAQPIALLPAVAAPAAAPPLGAGEWRAARARVDDFLRDYLDRQREESVPAGQASFALLYDDLKEFVCRPGKRLRPLLFLLAHRLFADPLAAAAPALAREDDLLAIGASLELLHGFILIHDDIIDRSETRRGLPTLHRGLEARLPAFVDRGRAGKNLALVLGDILFALAQKCLLAETHGLDAAMRQRLSTRLLGCLIETGFGEAADILHGTRDVARVSLAEIEQMYLFKTTRYTIECPLAMAAILAGAEAGELAQLGRVARPAGLAFQIQNDLQEFARFELSDAEVPADLLEGKKTLLIRTAFTRLSETDRGLLQLCFGGGGPSEAAVHKAQELIVKSGAVRHLRRTMEKLCQEADAAARSPIFAPGVQEGLVTLIHLVRDGLRV